MKKSLKMILLMFVFAVVLYGCGDSSNDAEADENGDTSGSSDSVTMTAHTKWPDDNFTSDNLREYRDLVDELTDGSLQLEVNTGGQLGYEGPELLSAVRDNLVPLSDIFTSEVGGEEPLFLLTTMPFLMSGYEEMEIFYDIAEPYFAELLEEKWNQKFLFGEHWPYAGFHTQDEINSVADMSGMKMRTYDENGAAVVESVGGTPMPMPFSEVYSSLSTGIIDSVLTSSTTGVDGTFWEVLNYYAQTNVTAGYSMVTINLDEYNKLSEEQQNALVEAGEELAAKKIDNVIAEDEEMISILEENGMTTIEPSDEFMKDLQEIGDEITNNWLENDAPPEAVEIVEKFREEVGR
jgi:TRAP-type C4-dicarboxylate transport system substrate-binding protein